VQSIPVRQFYRYGSVECEGDIGVRFGTTLARDRSVHTRTKCTRVASVCAYTLVHMPGLYL
jgi:hypothetical protein